MVGEDLQSNIGLYLRDRGRCRLNLSADRIGGAYSPGLDFLSNQKYIDDQQASV